jgi:FAD/FMN-containing dehydrogenase
LHSAAKAKAAEFQNVVALGATAFAPGKADRWPGWEDSAVPPDSIEDYLRALKKTFRSPRLQRIGLRPLRPGTCALSVAVRIQHAGRKKFHAFLNDAADLVVSYGGSISGEHGAGQARAELLPKMFGEASIGRHPHLWDRGQSH